MWQQQLGRDLSLDELHLLKRLASDGIAGSGNIGSSHMNGYGDSPHGQRNAPLSDSALSNGVPSWQAGMGVSNMANGVGSFTNGFNSATPPNVNDLQNGYLANYSSSGGGLLGGSGGNGMLPTADGDLASQLAMNGLVGGMGLSSAAAAAAASRGAFGEGPRIYVGGVPDLVTVAMVRDHFSRWGVVRDVHFPKERSSRRRRHFCFVTFESLQAAERAVAESNREIGGFPVAAINIPTDRLTHYGLRQGGMGPSLQASPLHGTSMYGSVGATLPDINMGGSMRSASLATPSAYNNVTHQIGSQRVRSTRGPQPPLFSGNDNFVATATQDEISAALAALRMGSSPQHHLGQHVSAASFPPGSSNGLYQKHSAPIGDSQGFPLSHLNPAMQQHLMALASAQAGSGSSGGGTNSRPPSMDGMVASEADRALSSLHMNGGAPQLFPSANRAQQLNVVGPGAEPLLMANGLKDGGAPPMVSGGHQQGSGTGGGGGSESGMKTLSGNYPMYADQLKHSHNNQLVHNGHKDMQGTNGMDDRNIRSASFDTLRMSMPWNSAAIDSMDVSNQVRSMRSSSVSPQGNRMSVGPAALPRALLTNDSSLYNQHHVPFSHHSTLAAPVTTAGPLGNPSSQGPSLDHSSPRNRSSQEFSSADVTGSMASLVNAFQQQQIHSTYAPQGMPPITEASAMAGILGFDHLANDRSATATAATNET